MDRIPFSFPITVFEQTDEKVSETITKKRCAIFYKGENRNGSYISEDFAEDLIKTLPYAPIKGIYDTYEEDYTDHGTKRSEGKIYGVVPEQFNFAWEKRLDQDGVEREYACADVYLFTALYEEANQIAGKGQSMELYGPSIQGSWIDINGKTLFKYTKACFLGLQVLGDNAVPCFQGASFFSLQDQQIYSLLTTLLEKIDQLSIGRDTQMDNENTLTFTLSANQKQSAIMKALNTESFRYYVLDNYDNYAIVFDYEAEKYLKVNYTIDENDQIALEEEFAELVPEFVTADEKAVLSELRSRTEAGTYEAVMTEYDNIIQENNGLKTELETKETAIATLVEEKDTAINDLNQLIGKVDELSGQIDTYVATINECNATIENLSNYKKSVELAEKQNLIAKYATKINTEIIEQFSANIDNYTIIELKKELALALVENNDGIFTAKEGENIPQRYIPAEQPLSGVEALLSKYKK